MGRSRSCGGGSIFAVCWAEVRAPCGRTSMPLSTTAPTEDDEAYVEPIQSPILPLPTDLSKSLSLAYTTIAPTRPPREEPLDCSFHSGIEHRTLASTMHSVWTVVGLSGRGNRKLSEMSCNCACACPNRPESSSIARTFFSMDCVDRGLY